MLWLLFSYMLVLIVLSKVLAKRMEGMLAFFLANRALPWPLVMMAFIASWIGAASTIGTMDKAYHEGVSAFWYMAIPSTLSMVVITRFFAARVNQLKALSMPQAFEAHYGKLGGFFLSLVILLASITLMASQLVALGQLLHTTTGLTLASATWLSLAVIVTYSVIGGFRAVVMTDVLQVFLLTLALGILCVFTVSQGWPYLTPLPAGAPATFWSMMEEGPKHVMIAVTFVLGWCIAPEMWQRMQAVQKQSHAVAVGVGSTLWTIGLFLMVVFTGLAALGYLSHQGVVVEPGHTTLIVLAQQLPWPWLTAVVILGAMAAIFSTIDSSLNITTLTVSHDLIKRLWWPNATEGQMVALSRAVTAVVGIPSVGIALQYQDIIEVLWISADVYASTIFIPVVMMFLWPKARPLSGILAIGFGLVPVLIGFASSMFELTMPSWWPGWPYTTLLGVSFSALGFFLGSRLGESTVPEVQGVQVAN